MLYRHHDKIVFMDGHKEELVEDRETGEFFLVPVEPDKNPIILTELIILKTEGKQV